MGVKLVFTSWELYWELSSKQSVLFLSISVLLTRHWIIALVLQSTAKYNNMNSAKRIADISTIQKKGII